MIEQLKEGRKELLKSVNRRDKPTTSEIAEQDGISEYFSSSKSVNNALNQLQDDYELVEKEVQGRERVWKLTHAGHKLIDSIFSQERQADQGSRFYNLDRAATLWADFFEEELERQLQKVAEGRDYVNIDFEKLSKFDADLADQILLEPEKSIGAAQTAIRERTRLVQLESSRSVDIRISNVDEIDSKQISEVSGNDVGRMVCVEGIIQSVSDGRLEMKEADFECRQCAKVYTRTASDDLDDAVTQPYKCGECGNQTFDMVDRRMEERRVMTLKEKPDVRNRDSLRVVVQGKLAKDKRKNIRATGSPVRITGYLEPLQKNKQKNIYRKRLRANNIELLEEKWDVRSLEPAEERRIQSISERDDLRDLLVRSLAEKELAHMELPKEAALVYLLGKNDNSGNIHVLIIGEPGTGKSELARYIEDNFPKTVGTVGTGATGVGLTATVRRDEVTGDYVAEAGQLPMADEGYHITDEFDKIGKKDAIKINEALSEGTISLSKANISTKMSAEVSELAIGNPKDDIFDRHEEKYKQIPIDDSQVSLKDRFDIVIGLERGRWQNKKDRERELDKVDTILDRAQDSDSEGQEAESLDIETLVNYIAYAQRVEPELSKEAKDKIREFHKSIKQKESENQNLWDVRRVESMKYVSKAYARLELSEVVHPRHVQQAEQLLKRALASIDFQVGVDDYMDLSSTQKQARANILDKLHELAEADKEGVVKVQSLIEKLDISEERAEDKIQELKSDGEIYEAERGKVAPI